MPDAVVIHTPFTRDAPVCGIAADAHWDRVLSLAGLQRSDNLGGAIIAVDARYVALRPASLAELASRLSGGAYVIAPNGDIIASAHDGVPLSPKGERIVVDTTESLPADDNWTLSQVETVLRRRVISDHARSGVRFVLPETTVIDPGVELAAGVVIWGGVVLTGQTIVAAGTEIQSGAWLADCLVGENVLIKPYSVCTRATIGAGSSIGPMAHLRPGTILGNSVKVGNFVETKAARLGTGAKASHLTYLGDVDVGAGANIGAGTITCNYDGHGKNRTKIGAGAFIGSNTALVAPIEIGEGAIVGAGSVVTRSVPDNALAIERAKQRILEGRAPLVQERNRQRAARKKSSLD
jgi:UDP-N-acetylglucosamine diphosphorylase/glucosamine-1-phosphate N-acetyltransferase